VAVDAWPEIEDPGEHDGGGEPSGEHHDRETERPLGQVESVHHWLEHLEYREGEHSPPDERADDAAPPQLGDERQHPLHASSGGRE
jgi:hypothetical protein